LLVADFSVKMMRDLGFSKDVKDIVLGELHKAKKKKKKMVRAVSAGRLYHCQVHL
jgi:hypothetical protein